MLIVNRSGDRVNVFNVASSDYLDVTSIARIVIEEMGLKNVRLRYAGGDRGWKGMFPRLGWMYREYRDWDGDAR